MEAAMEAANQVEPTEAFAVAAKAAAVTVVVDRVAVTAEVAKAVAKVEPRLLHPRSSALHVPDLPCGTPGPAHFLPALRLDSPPPPRAAIGICIAFLPLAQDLQRPCLSMR
jgi:hypothetical protein